MNIADVMDELGEALESIEGLRVFPYWPDRVIPPWGTVGFPEVYTFDRTYGRGQDYAQFPVTVAVSRTDARTTRQRLAKYVDGSGSDSVKAAIDGHDTDAWDEVRVVGTDAFEEITVADVKYIGATFNVDVWAKGAP